MALTKEQSNWMYKKLDALYQKYFPKIPFNQDTWDELMSECTAIDNLCKGEKYSEVRDLIFALMEYMDKLNAKGYKEAGE